MLQKLRSLGPVSRLIHRVLVRLPSRLAILRRRRAGDVIVDLLETHLEPGGRYLDIGANRGDYAAVAAGRVGRDGMVVAVEPGATHRVRLSKWATSAPGRVFLPAAVDAVAGVMHLSVPLDRDGNPMHWLATGRERLANAMVEITPVATVDDIWQASGPFDVVKIDVEGLEGNVLKGMRGCLGDVPTLIIEIEARHCGVDALAATIDDLATEFPHGFFIRDGGLVPIDDFDVTRDQVDQLSASNYSGEGFESGVLPATYVSDFVFFRDAPRSAVPDPSSRHPH